MPWAGQTWLKLIQEGTGGANYGVFNATPTAGQILYPSLLGGNNFTVRRTPLRQEIRTADAGNRAREVVAGRRQFQGVQNTVLRPDEAAFYITAATSLTNDANGHPCLPSYSAMYYDSTRAWKLLGGRVQTLTLTTSSTQDYTTLSVNWIFQKRDDAISLITDFPQPAQSNYSKLIPYQHIETKSHLTLGGVAITKYRTLTITFGNVLVPTWDEDPEITDAIYCGRNFDFTFGPQYVAKTMRDNWEQQSPLTFVLNWTRGTPAHSLTIDCQTNSYLTTFDDDFPLDGPAYNTAGVRAFYDTTTGTDYTVTVS